MKSVPAKPSPAAKKAYRKYLSGLARVATDINQNKAKAQAPDFSARYSAFWPRFQAFWKDARSKLQYKQTQKSWDELIGRLRAVDDELTGFLQEFESKAKTTVKEVSEKPEAYQDPDSPAKAVADKGGLSKKAGIGIAVGAVALGAALLFGLKK